VAKPSLREIPAGSAFSLFRFRQRISSRAVRISAVVREWPFVSDQMECQLMEQHSNLLQTFVKLSVIGRTR